MGELYKLDFPNGKSYIGIALQSALKRFNRHQKNAMGNGLTVLCHAWRKYGEPKLTVLAVIDNSILQETEIEAIKAYRTLTPDGYNMTLGGAGVVGLIFSTEHRMKLSTSIRRAMTPEHRAKLSVAIRASMTLAIRAKIGTASRNCSAETRAKNSAAHKGKALSPEHRAKVSAAKRGGFVSREHRAKISFALKGRKLSEETRTLISTAHKGKVKSPETRARMSIASRNKSPAALAKMSAAAMGNKNCLGKKHSPELRAQQSEYMKRVWANRKAQQLD